MTKERLGCYLPTEHIDNPKGYAENEDARKYDSRLRGPVDPRELEIDPQTGMKNYIANGKCHASVSLLTPREWQLGYVQGAHSSHASQVH